MLQSNIWVFHSFEGIIEFGYCLADNAYSKVADELSWNIASANIRYA